LQEFPCFLAERQYAKKAAAEFQVGYTVYRVLAGRIRIVGRFPAARVRPCLDNDAPRLSLRWPGRLRFHS